MIQTTITFSSSHCIQISKYNANESFRNYTKTTENALNAYLIEYLNVSISIQSIRSMSSVSSPSWLASTDSSDSHPSVVEVTHFVSSLISSNCHQSHSSSWNAFL